MDKFKLSIEVVSQEEESFYTAFGCYNNLDYDKNILRDVLQNALIGDLLFKEEHIIDKTNE